MFTVLLPSRNRIELLRYAVKSVLEQDFADFEIVISDNASDENYAAFVAELSDRRVVYTRSDELISVTDNWNKALDAATHDYVLMLGDDDSLTPGLLRKLAEIIRDYKQPDVVYLMAYHYLYPGVIPEAPSGAFSSVANSELFTRGRSPYLLDPKQAIDLAGKGTSFRHLVSFNAQHFVWQRKFTLTTPRFFRPPYPDYFACFYTFTKAARIVVVPEPSIIIGIAKQSFGSFFMNNQQDEGNTAFASGDDEQTDLGSMSIDLDRALQFDGTVHYRNWLLTSVRFKKEIAPDIDIDTTLYKKIQIVEMLAEQIATDPDRSRPHRDWPDFATFADTSWNALLQAVAQTHSPLNAAINEAKNNILHDMGVYYPARVENIVLDRHVNIYDAFKSLEQRAIEPSRALQEVEDHIVPRSLKVEIVPPKSWRLATAFNRLVRGRIEKSLPSGDDVQTRDEALTAVEQVIVASGLFDAKFYFHTNPDVAAAGVDPIAHFVEDGWKEGRDPNESFDMQWYLATNPDVAAAGLNPFLHYIEHGKAEGRDSGAFRSSAKHIGGAVSLYREAGGLTAATLLDLESDKWLTNIQKSFLPYRPMNVSVDHRLAAVPRLRILLPSLKKKHATGGPNTAYLLGCLLAREGVRITFVSFEAGPDAELDPIKAHLRSLTGLDPDLFGIAFEDASDRNKAYPIGINDVFMATAWATALAAAAAMQLTRASEFYYLVQDYETLFFGASERQIFAENSYDLSYVPVINSGMLKDHLVEKRIGRFAEGAFADKALAFEPAIDRARFYPIDVAGWVPRKLLFYARPTIAERNLFNLGVTALRAAVRAGLFQGEAWAFLGMGESFGDIDLGRGQVLRPTPWLDFEGYAEQMREADVLLSLMLSPHPSYPPLEMAACGGSTVTTTFGSKTARRLQRLSPNIIGVAPTIEDLVIGLSKAVVQADLRRSGRPTVAIDMPGTWDESLSPVVTAIIAQLRPTGAVVSPESVRLPPPVSYVRTGDGIDGSPRFYTERLSERRRLYRDGSSAGLLTLASTVYDTPAPFLFDLAHSVFGQDTSVGFEWLILDNGSSKPETLAALQEIGRHPRVRLSRVPDNLGIVGGMHWCLEHALSRYIVPLDSDDLLFPDCLRTIAASIEQTGFPPLLYTDEDKTDGLNQKDAYVKPEWDPVLLVHSCYIAHLTAIDRLKALELGCYSDSRADGCHDWDTFTRFMSSGLTPVHVPEVLYSWRMHAQSTSGNYRSKPYIFESHRFVLRRFLASLGAEEKYALGPAPLFDQTPDYRFVPIEEAEAAQALNLKLATLRLGSVLSTSELTSQIDGLDTMVDKIHLLATSHEAVGEAWRSEVVVLFELFPDTAVLGGRIHDGEKIVEAGFVFGYRGGIACPDRDRSLRDPGYFAQIWKPHSVAAVSARHCVVERKFLAQCLTDMPKVLTLDMIGPWIGAMAARQKRRVIYSPYLEATGPKVEEASAEAIALFNARFGDLASTTVGYPGLLDRSGDAPYRPSRHPVQPVLMPYATYFANRLKNRGELLRRPNLQLRTISIITTVYHRTDASLFAATADAIRNQTSSPLEWLVLAHGKISDALAIMLKDLAASRRLTLLFNEVNLGIQGGLRYCLEHARGEFVISVDADDLLTPDALELLSIASSNSPDAKIFYSDEDLLVDGNLCHPFYRPDFDPALLLSHSFAWHTIMFERTNGLALGVYTRADMEYAQDWDTLLRFYLSGFHAVHVDEVLYHWRQHASSLSNSGTTFAGSLSSVQAALASIIDSKATRSHMEVASYPIPVGIPDFFIRRLPINPPTVDLLRFEHNGTVNGSIPIDFPFTSTSVVEVARGPQGMEAMDAALKGKRSEFVLLLSAALTDIDPEGLWQAIKHFELIEECVAVCGCISRIDGRIVSAAPVLVDATTLVDPLESKSTKFAGNFSLAAKPHIVSALSPDLAIFRRSFLARAFAAYPEELAFRAVGVWLGSFARQEAEHIVYEPLLRAYVRDETSLIGDPIAGMNNALKRMDGVRGKVPTHGLAGFVRQSSHHA